jgi:flagellin
MALVVNTNVSSLVAQRNLMESKNALDTAMERLSSGKRINSAADDAAGLAISNRMESQIRGLNMAVRNANDGISLAQTAEGAMEEITNMLQRMRELSLQAANSVNNELDRDALDAEVRQLVSEIDRVAEQTRFNDVNLLDGSFQGAQIQVGIKANESIGFDIRDVSSSSLGREANTVGALANTTASAEGIEATETVARLSFSGPDTYTFKVENVSVSQELRSAYMSTDLAALATQINNNLNAANANNKVVAQVKNGAIELRNTAGDAIAVTAFQSSANGTATFDVLEGGGSSKYLSDVATNVATDLAQGTVASDTGVRLKLEDAGNYSFKLNGVSVSIAATETTDADIQSKLEDALGTGYEVYINGDTISAAFGAASTGHTAGNTITLAAEEYLIFNQADGKAVNITQFQALDGLTAGVAGTIRVATNDDEALLIDDTNKFTANASTDTTVETELSLHFTSSTSDYEIEINDKVYYISADDLAAGTAGASLMGQLNIGADFTAGGLGSLGNTVGTGNLVGAATDTSATYDLEVVQNGNQIFLKAAQAAGDFEVKINTDTSLNYAVTGTGDAHGSYVAVTKSARHLGAAIVTTLTEAAGDGVDPFDAVAPSVATFRVNDAAGAGQASTEVDLVDSTVALFTTATATATKASLLASGNGTFSFKIADSAGNTTGAIATAVSNGSASQMIADINAAITATANLTGKIVAAADPNNSLGVVLTRADGGNFKITDFSSAGSETLIWSPSSGQGTTETLDDTTYETSATATAAGIATATGATLTFDDVTSTSNNFTSFKITDGRSTAVVRRTELATAAVTDIQAELNKALQDAGMTHITATATVASGVNKITFADSTGGLIKITDFATDNGVEARWSPTSGQGTPGVLSDDAGTATTGTAIADISITSEQAAASALEVIDNALQDVDDERALLGAVQNRLTHTISNLTNVSTNTSAAQSRIQDADFAVEAANLAKAQVLQQAGTSMLAQANASPQYVLSLLQ